jgi:glycosyltransferase involved in cell wall biosynthesis
MKIVHLIEYFSPALGYQETYLAREQQRMGHDVTVLTSDRHFPFPDYDSTVGDILGTRVVGIGEFREESLHVIRKPIWFEVFARAWLADLIPTLRALNPDVIHIHSTSSLSAVRVAYAKHHFQNTRVLVDDHSHLSVLANHWSKASFYWIFRHLFGAYLSQHLDVFVAITNETAQIMHTYMGITASIKIVELGADTRMFRYSSAQRKQLRKKFTFDESDVVFIYTGKIIADKGVDILVKAFCELGSHRAKLLIIGSGPKPFLDALKSTLEQVKKSNDVIWIPMVLPARLPAYYSAADVGIWPRQESISMIEAAACELPVIVKSSPSMYKRVKDKNGSMYKEGNVKQLRSAMHEMMRNAKLRRSMGKRGRQLVEREYSWSSIAKQFLALYSRE